MKNRKYASVFKRSYPKSGSEGYTGKSERLIFTEHVSTPRKYLTAEELARLQK
jgi:hypothetical protein